jgi:hypothetical protein
VELNATIAQNEYLAAIGKPQRTTYSGKRLCSTTIVNPPIPCPPDKPYCTPVPAKPRPPHIFAPKVKLALRQAAIAAALRGLFARAVLKLNGLLPRRLRFLTVHQQQYLRGYGRGAQLASNAYLYLATVVDPPDSNFRSVAGARQVRVARSAAGRGRFARDLNALDRDDAALGPVARALVTALDRASGAAAVGDTADQQAQLHAAAGFARWEARNLRADARLRHGLEGLVSAVDLLSARQFRALRARVKHVLWPMPIGSLLGDAAADDADVSAARLLDRLASAL